MCEVLKLFMNNRGVMNWWIWWWTPRWRLEAAALSLSVAALLEGSVDSRSSFTQESSPNLLLCLFVIIGCAGLIRPVLTLVWSHIPAPPGVAGQAPLTPVRPPHLPPQAHNTCPADGFWEFDAVREQVGCSVHPRPCVPRCCLSSATLKFVM